MTTLTLVKPLEPLPTSGPRVRVEHRFLAWEGGAVTTDEKKSFVVTVPSAGEERPGGNEVMPPVGQGSGRR